MDRQQFFSQVTDIGNSGQVEEGENCLICQAKYGIRHKFFEGDKAVDDADVVTDDEEEDGCCHDDEDEQDYYQDLCEEREMVKQANLQPIHDLVDWIGTGLGLDRMHPVDPVHPIVEIANIVVEKLWDLDAVRETDSFDDLNLAAACVYMASHLVRQRLTFRELAHVSGLTQKSISTTYGLLDQEAGWIVDDDFIEWDMSQHLKSNDVERLLNRLPYRVNSTRRFLP